ncbi:hypothetical protein NOSIN_09955 [Nocardiopsis sinuspersici]|uniref:Uncharacterized protein n=1 Tax=Nocardiopsis sinuspersici TaxID=501010 RepID=A0A1V3C0T4_9ACTN|nr:hypothetical protein NOSIN_09955 [Nocardiopsis sinuspersici]
MRVGTAQEDSGPPPASARGGRDEHGRRRCPYREVAAAADALLDTLSKERRRAVVYDFDDEAEATGWSNFPVTSMERGGPRSPIRTRRRPVRRPTGTSSSTTGTSSSTTGPI